MFAFVDAFSYMKWLIVTVYGNYRRVWKTLAVPTLCETVLLLFGMYVATWGYLERSVTSLTSVVDSEFTQDTDSEEHSSSST